MAPVVNERYLFNELPTGPFIVDGKTILYDKNSTIDPENVKLNAGVLLKTLVIGIDPYLRGLLLMPPLRATVPAFQVGKPLLSYGVAVVLRSENSAFAPGDHVYGMCELAEYSVRNDAAGLTVLKNEEKIRWSAYVGIAGMPGQTAFFGWKEYAEPKKGEVVFVSGGAGPVGSLVIQLAKRAGCKVIASAGSQAKVDFMKSIGADVVFNYKDTKTADVLAQHGEVNIYWDNVGGETLEAALNAAAMDARFIICGMISAFSKPYAIPNLHMLIGKSIRMSGFVVSRLRHKYEKEFYATIPRLIASGEIKDWEHRLPGLKHTEEALASTITGKVDGKPVLVLADE